MMLGIFKKAEPFRLRCDNCAHLLTTRIPEIALEFAGKTTHIPELSDADGLTLLGQFIPEIVDEQQETMQKLERDVGGLPLALFLIGKYLRKEASSGQPSRISGAIKKLQSATERLQLSGEQDLLAAHPSLPAGASVSLQTIIAITIEKRDEKVRSAFGQCRFFRPSRTRFRRKPPAQYPKHLPKRLIYYMITVWRVLPVGGGVFAVGPRSRPAP